MVEMAKLCCTACNKTETVKACNACLKSKGDMTKFGGRKCKACGGPMKLQACNKAASIPTSYDMYKKSLLERTSSINKRK